MSLGYHKNITIFFHQFVTLGSFPVGKWHYINSRAIVVTESLRACSSLTSQLWFDSIFLKQKILMGSATRARLVQDLRVTHGARTKCWFCCNSVMIQRELGYVWSGRCLCPSTYFFFLLCSSGDTRSGESARGGNSWKNKKKLVLTKQQNKCLLSQ